MMMDTTITIAEELAARRRELGMSFPQLAERSGVSEPTAKRILGGHAASASYASVAAVAEALGMPLGSNPIDPDEFRERVALEKAKRLARMVQGTSALEAQAVSPAEFSRLVDQSVHELLARSPRRLWSR